MTTSSPSIIQRYGKALCHLNHARVTKRLGLILGAGVSYDLGIPRWTDLVNKIEKKLAYSSGNAPESYRAEQLYQHFKKQKTTELKQLTGDSLESAITAGWRDLVAGCLYEKFYDSNHKRNIDAYEAAIKKHPYLPHLGKLAQTAQLVVTHNFDDALEAAINLEPSASTGSSYRRYHSFWRPEPFLRREMVNIYHPNGFTPLRRGPKGSDDLILTEASFADHLANTNTEESHFLLRHLADKTCLIIGHSLADGTLKNALRQHANQRPGHVNYYVHWDAKGDSGLSEDQRHAIREANFETYNLITIFANSSDIAEIVENVSLDARDLADRLTQNSMHPRYVYYVVGAVSSGKSTTLRHLRDLATVEEWPDDMPPIMNRPSLGLKRTQEEEIDARLENAIWAKNSEIEEVRVGIVAVDRAPLDFIAFPSKKGETLGATARKRATAVLGRFEARKFQNMCEGQVIVVQADTEVLIERQLQRSNRTTPQEAADGTAHKYLSTQQGRLAEVYKKPIKEGSVVRTDRCSIGAAVKAAARIIHFGEYRPFDVAGRLRMIQKGK